MGPLGEQLSPFTPQPIQRTDAFIGLFGGARASGRWSWCLVFNPRAAIFPCFVTDQLGGPLIWKIFG